jgi:hypothetical protein
VVPVVVVHAAVGVVPSDADLNEHCLDPSVVVGLTLCE